jgi:hypothetical protein
MRPLTSASALRIVPPVLHIQNPPFTTPGAWQTLLVNGVSGGAIMDWQLTDENLEYLAQFSVIVKPPAPLTADQEKVRLIGASQAQCS